MKPLLDSRPQSGPVCKTLADLRHLVLETARETEGVGPIEEALRWGQHSFLTSETGSGSTIRIDAVRDNTSRCALYFHCQSGLVASFRERYPELSYGGDRCIFVATDRALPREALKHCISLALTHHLRKKRSNPQRIKSEINTTHHYRHRSRSG